MRIALLLAVVLTAAVPVCAAAQPAQRGYEQTPAVLARFPDVPITLDAPGVAPGRDAFTTQEEMLAHLQAIKRRVPGVLLGSLGRSIEGRDLPYLVFTAEGYTDLRRIQRLRRPVVWLIGQQHGDEPAGGEAMLALASALADGELRPLLRQVTVVVVPRANPDGAAAYQRRNAQGFDLNRDHLVVTQPETRAIQAAMNALPPDAVVDAHEYGAGHGWINALGGLAPWDATLLRTTHPAAPASTTALSDTLIEPGMQRRLNGAGLSHYAYLLLTGEPRGVGTGGAAPGISRNYYGLTGALSFLVETRSASPRQSFQRRVATHYLAAAGALEAVASRPELVRSTVTAARRAMSRDRSPLPVAHQLGRTPVTLAVIDPATGRDMPFETVLADARALSVTQTRLRPQGYLLAPQARSAIEALRVKRMTVCRVVDRRPTPVEAFHVRRTAPVTRATREASNLRSELVATLQARSVTPGEGWVYVPMAQPGSAVIAASLEPDSVGSHVGVGVIEPAADGTAPVYRVMPGSRRPRLAPGRGC